MNPYNDDIPYDYIFMPYNGLVPTPQPTQAGGRGGPVYDGRERRRKNQNAAAILTAIEHYYNDSS